MNQPRIGVLFGGMSSETQVSQHSGEAVVAALRSRGHLVVPIYADRDLDMALRQHPIDVAFIALHGRLGEDGCVQGLLEVLGIPYTGSDVLASATAMHKVRAKELFRLHNLPTPAYYPSTVEDAAAALQRHGEFGYPCVVKPVREGSSLGVTICESADDFAAAWDAARCFDDEVVVERYIAGMEVSVAIVGDRALGAIEVARTGVFDYSAKCGLPHERYFTPPRLTPERYRTVLATALRAHRALGCQGATRVDLIVTTSGNEYVLEVNTVPGLAPGALLPRIAAAAGIGFADLCEMMIAGAGLGAGRRRGERRILQREFAGLDRRSEACNAH
ncbi:MAG: D-alanine--D-alanine ligase [Kofleriaceae bacterium]|nr:D-alanine--D-alanine ligase [Kofleriaceae bacterium]